MSQTPIVYRGLRRVAEEAKRAQLEIRRRKTSGDDVYVDYGWIRLLYSGDGDLQELSYHRHQEQWRDAELQVFRSLLAPGQTVVDVGANMGFLTTIFASLVGARGRVISFEPSPAVFSKLQKTVEANNLAQVVPINAGCGANAGVVRLGDVGRSSGNASILADGADGTDIRIQRLDDTPEVWESPVSLIKIDTEGYEPEVLRGAERLLAEHSPIIYLEMGGEYVDSTLQTITILDEAGYDIEHVRTVEWTEVGNGSNYFFFPRGRARNR